MNSYVSKLTVESTPQASPLYPLPADAVVAPPRTGRSVPQAVMRAGVDIVSAAPSSVLDAQGNPAGSQSLPDMRDEELRHGAQRPPLKGHDA